MSASLGVKLSSDHSHFSAHLTGSAFRYNAVTGAYARVSESFVSDKTREVESSTR